MVKTIILFVIAIFLFGYAAGFYSKRKKGEEKEEWIITV